MIHRDIKPANLLDQEPGADTIQVKILDFGPALAASSERRWMDPNDPDGAEYGDGDPLFPIARTIVDPHVHGISGLILYSLDVPSITRLPWVPFPGGSTLDKLIRQNGELAEPIEELCPDVPGHVRAIVQKPPAKDPDDRFQTPDELMDACSPHASPTRHGLADCRCGPALTRRQRRTCRTGRVLQVDTEPRAQDATKITDEDSVLDWIDTNRRRRRRGTGSGDDFGVIVAGIAGVILWHAAASAAS